MPEGRERNMPEGRMQKIKLVVILEATLGGTRKHVVELLLGLNKDLFDITFMYSLRRADATFRTQLPLLERNGVRLMEISLPGGINPVNYMLLLLRIRRALFSIDPDIIHLHGAKAGAVGRIAAFFSKFERIIYTPHGGSFHKFTTNIGGIYLMVEKFLLCKTMFVVGVSNDSCVKAKRYLKLHPRKNRRIYNGLDLGAIDDAIRSSAPAALRKSPDEFIIIYPALMLEEKGHVEFIEAVGTSEVPLDDNVKIFLVGDGPLRERVASLITQYGLEDQIIILGFRTDMLALMSDSDLVLLLSKNEAFGYVLLEAMACSKPVLASRVGGIPEIIHDTLNGRLVNIDEESRIAELINEYRRDKEMLHRMGRHGRELINTKFSIRSMIDNTEKLYRDSMKHADRATRING
jgi:glycosyltransferase involved in cell wall biosynthesis